MTVCVPAPVGIEPVTLTSCGTPVTNGPAHKTTASRVSSTRTGDTATNVELVAGAAPAWAKRVTPPPSETAIAAPIAAHLMRSACVDIDRDFLMMCSDISQVWRNDQNMTIVENE
ncbi:unannotated protein [freshwater metagenome]|uniref:Unannotated protein n=1 Tax=freshwater metagenome TaxID=449393 RepID=A0A6J6ZD14_9ZZZZ